MDELELSEIRRTADARRMTVAEWVRQSLRAAREKAPTIDASRKIAIVRAAARHQFPTADIDAMLAETEAGYHVEGAP